MFLPKTRFSQKYSFSFSLDTLPSRKSASGVPGVRGALLGAVLLSASFLAAPAQVQAATLRGTVTLPPTSVSGSMQDVRIRLDRIEGDHRQWFTRPDEAGAYVFSDLPAGRYRVSVQHPSASTPPVEITFLTVHAEHLVTLILTRRTVVTSEVVEVTDRANRAESPAAFSNLSRVDLEERAQIKDIPAVLSELPSTTWFSENGNGAGYNYVSIRGFDQRRISVMIDGVPQNDPEDHNVYWINFYDLTGALEDIQVQRGAGTTISGPPSIGGSINLVTRQLSPEPWAKVALGYGTFTGQLPETPSDALIADNAFPCGAYNTQRYTAEANSGLLGKRFVLYGRLSHVCSSGYRDWSWSQYWRGFLGGAWYGDTQSLTVRVFGGPQSDALAYYGIAKDANDDELERRGNYGAPADGRTGAREEFAPYQGYITHNYVMNPRLALNNTLFFSTSSGYFDFDGSWGDPYYFRIDETEFPEFYLDSSDPNYAGIPSDTMLRAFVQNQQVGWLPRVTRTQEFAGGASGELNAGLELRMHRSLHWGRIQQASFSSEAQAALVGEEADRHYYEYQGGKDIFSPYVNERIQLGRLRLDGNLQVVAQRYRFFGEKYGENDFTVPYLFVNPRLGAHLAVSSRLTGFVSGAYTQREPRLKELYDAENASYGAVPALESVRPEKLLDLEAGTHFQGELFRVTGNLFYMDFQDEIVKTGGLDQFGQPYYGNADLTRHMGVELEGAVQVLEGLELTGNVSYSQNRFIRFTEYLDNGQAVSRDGNPIAGFPDLLGNLRASYRWGGLMAAVDARYVGDQFTDNSADTLDDGTSAQGIGRVDAYTLLNAQLAWTPRQKPLRGLTLSAELQNLTDARVLMAGQGLDNFFPNAPRAFYFQVQYEAGR